MNIDKRDNGIPDQIKNAKNSEIETRFIPINDLKIETREDGPTKIVGYFAVFNKPTDIGFWTEEIIQGAFSKTLKEDDIRALFNHDANFPLGRNKNGTLSLREDPNGLYAEITTPNVQWAKDLMVSVERGDISGGSIGFIARKQEWTEKEEDGKVTYHRMLQEVELLDVSPVTFPAYEETQVNVRSLEAFRSERQEEKEEKKKETETDGQIQIDTTRREREIKIREMEV